VKQIGFPDIVWLPFVGSPGQRVGPVQLGGSCGRTRRRTRSLWMENEPLELTNANSTQTVYMQSL
jgi:hypothetical protein